MNPSLHTTPPQFAKLLKSSGWYTVKLIDILLRHPGSGKIESIGEPSSKYATGKGTIVDSGTTDTYLPFAVRNAFEKLFRTFSNGVRYNNNRISLTKAQYEVLPTIIYRLGGVHSEYIDIESPPSSYAETMRSGVSDYAFRIYLTGPCFGLF